MSLVNVANYSNTMSAENIHLEEALNIVPKNKNAKTLENFQTIKVDDKLEKASAEKDEQQSKEILNQIEELDGKEMNDEASRKEAKKKLAALDEEYQNGGDEMLSKAAGKRRVQYTPDHFGGKVAQLDAHDFDGVADTLVLFDTLNQFLPSWESATGTAQNTAGESILDEVARDFASTVVTAVGETSLRSDTLPIFQRACEALGLVANRDGESLRGVLFDETGKPNDEAIKKFAMANKELLTNPSIAISKENIVSPKKASGA